MNVAENEHEAVRRAHKCVLKKVENLEHALALHFMRYNFVRIHQSLRVTPAMKAGVGVTDRFWTLEDVLGLLD